MNALLQKRYKYKIEGSLEDVRSEIKSLLRSPWHDASLAKNISGKFIDEYSFVARHKFSIPITVLGFYPSYAILQGKLSFEEGRTIIRLIAGPSIPILVLFYFALLFFIFIFITLQAPLSFDSFLIPIVIAVGIFILFILINFSMHRIRRRFEGFLGIKMSR